MQMFNSKLTQQIMANTLKKKSTLTQAAPIAGASNTPNAPVQQAVDSGINQMLADGFTNQIGPVFPDELQDPDAARSLRIAFYLGVRYGATRIAESTSKPIINATAVQCSVFIQEKKAADSANLNPTA
jgi:hypothetical protein